MLHTEDSSLHRRRTQSGPHRKPEVSASASAPAQGAHTPYPGPEHGQLAHGWQLERLRPPPTATPPRTGYMPEMACFGGCGPEVASTGATPSHSSFFGFKPAFFPAARTSRRVLLLRKRSGPVGFSKALQSGLAVHHSRRSLWVPWQRRCLDHSQAQGYPATCFFPVPRAV